MEPVKKYSHDEVGQLVARYYRGETDGSEVHMLAKGLQIENPSLSYRAALDQILRVKSDPDDSKLSPARREMNECLSDRAKCQRLAGDAVHQLTQKRLATFAKRDRQSHRAALADVARQYPHLWRAYQDGILRDGDFETLKFLVIGSSAEVKRGNYASDTVVKKYDF
jgi:hypothetical protein